VVLLQLLVPSIMTASSHHVQFRRAILGLLASL